MKTNKEKIVMQSLQGKIHHPRHNGGYRVGYDNMGRIIPGTGGITYNFAIGDCCMGIAGDHVEPGVSLQNSDTSENNALNISSCIGNEAKVISGDAKGKKGVVSGTHGGVEHVFIYFDQDTLEDLNVDDKIAIKGYGTGLQLLDYPNIKVMNIDPRLLEKLNIIEEQGTLKVGVTHIVPAHLMGSGLGSAQIVSGDYDIMTQDKAEVAKYHLDTLRFGDFVAIKDHNCHNGPHYLNGSCSIGVIVHSDSFTSGHGPGVAIILTSKDQTLIPFIDEQANLIHYIK
ncbi:MAG: DUF4438 domain-containing protein [Erysipelotrichia bacterium]|nr:DUF4438 domain-containing protein [Erysipelotrichia bacterium]NCC54448.1 DUF4438 domain-containing protein [Erysipelotrichia bacterium]